MMHIIEAGSTKLGKWICGVHLDEEKAKSHYKKIKHSIFKPCLVQEKIDYYPFYAYRKNLSSFVYLSHKELPSYFENIDMSTDDEYVYGEIFTIEKDYNTRDHDLMCDLLSPPVVVTNGFIHYLRTLVDNIKHYKLSTND